MSRLAPAHPTFDRNLRAGIAALAVVTAVMVGTLVPRSDPTPATADAGESSIQPGPDSAPIGGAMGDDGADVGNDGVVDERDGVLPAGVTPFDDVYAGLARLRPELLRAVRAAATEAARSGVTLLVNSGWRSADYQNQLVDEAVSEHGSLEEAARWVATVDTSAHVSGNAVDIGPSDAAAWVSRHGADHGLCPIYRNEPWHFEWIAEAVDHGCPALYDDPTHDPRMNGARRPRQPLNETNDVP